MPASVPRLQAPQEIVHPQLLGRQALEDEGGAVLDSVGAAGRRLQPGAELVDIRRGRPVQLDPVDAGLKPLSGPCPNLVRR